MIPLILAILVCVKSRYLDIKEHLRLKALRDQVGSNPNDAITEVNLSAASPAAELPTEYERYQHCRLLREAERIKEFSMQQRMCYVLG